MPCIVKTGVKAHDDTCLQAKMTRQVAVPAGVAMSDTIAEVRSWNDLHAAFRARAESLNVSRLVLDELVGYKVATPVNCLRLFRSVILVAVRSVRCWVLWDSNWLCKRTRKLLRESPDG